MKIFFAAAAILFVAIRAEEELDEEVDEEPVEEVEETTAEEIAVALAACTELLLEDIDACGYANYEDTEEEKTPEEIEAAITTCIQALEPCEDASGSIYVSTGAVIIATAALLM